MPANPPDAATPAPAVSNFGRAVRNRFPRGRLVDRARRAPLGQVARSSATFSQSMGRHLSMRCLIEERSFAATMVGGGEPLAVRGSLAAMHRLWRRDATEPVVAFGLRVLDGDSGGRDSTGPVLGLPSRGLQALRHAESTGGARQSEGPGGATQRLTRRPVKVQRLADVAAVGPMLTVKESGARRSPSAPRRSKGGPTSGDEKHPATPAPRLGRRLADRSGQASAQPAPARPLGDPADPRSPWRGAWRRDHDGTASATPSHHQDLKGPAARPPMVEAHESGPTGPQRRPLDPGEVGATRIDERGTDTVEVLRTRSGPQEGPAPKLETSIPSTARTPSGRRQGDLAGPLEVMGEPGPTSSPRRQIARVLGDEPPVRPGAPIPEVLARSRRLRLPSIDRPALPGRPDSTFDVVTRSSIVDATRAGQAVDHLDASLRATVRPGSAPLALLAGLMSSIHRRWGVLEDRGLGTQSPSVRRSSSPTVTMLRPRGTGDSASTFSNPEVQQAVRGAIGVERSVEGPDAPLRLGARLLGASERSSPEGSADPSSGPIRGVRPLSGSVSSLFNPSRSHQALPGMATKGWRRVGVPSSTRSSEVSISTRLTPISPPVVHGSSLGGVNDVGPRLTPISPPVVHGLSLGGVNDVGPRLTPISPPVVHGLSLGGVNEVGPRRRSPAASVGQESLGVASGGDRSAATASPAGLRGLSSGGHGLRRSVASPDVLVTVHRTLDAPGNPGRPVVAGSVSPPTGASRRPSAERGAPNVSDRFRKEIERRPFDAKATIPVQFAPLARSILGSGSVFVRSGPATREALAVIGKLAATMADVIYLPSPPDSSARSAEILAHELVHVGRPSPRARFFEDDHHDEEEAVANRVGGLVRALATSGDRPGASRVTAPVRDLAIGQMPVRGQVLRFSSGPGMPGTSTAGSHLGDLGGSPSSIESMMGPMDSTETPQSAMARSSVEPRTGDVGRRGGPSVGQSGPDTMASALTAQGPLAEALSMTRAPGAQGVPVGPEEISFSPETFDRLLDALEERVIAELERRGLHTGTRSF